MTTGVPLATTCTIQLPDEVWEGVIDHLNTSVDGRTQGLHACCLTCRAWTPRALYHLYRIVIISSYPALSKVSQTLLNAPHLRIRVEHLVISPGASAQQSWVSLVPVYFNRRLESLRCLTLRNFNFTNRHPRFHLAFSLFAPLHILRLENVHCTRWSPLARLMHVTQASELNMIDDEELAQSVGFLQLLGTSRLRAPNHDFMSLVLLWSSFSEMTKQWRILPTSLTPSIRILTSFPSGNSVPAVDDIMDTFHNFADAFLRRAVQDPGQTIAMAVEAKGFLAISLAKSYQVRGKETKAQTKLTFEIWLSEIGDKRIYMIAYLLVAISFLTVDVVGFVLNPSDQVKILSQGHDDKALASPLPGDEEPLPLAEIVDRWRIVDDALMTPGFRGTSPLRVRLRLPLHVLPNHPEHRCKSDLMRDLLPRFVGQNTIAGCSGCVYHTRDRKIVDPENQDALG